MARVGITRLGLGVPLAKSIDYDAFDTKAAVATPGSSHPGSGALIGVSLNQVLGDATRAFTT